MDNMCPICNCNSKLFTSISKFNYFLCKGCHSIFIDNYVLNNIDQGEILVEYNDNYWENEISSAKERAYGPALARMAEAFLYSRIPINKFLDISTGPGYFLDAIKRYLPNSHEIFYGIEKFPPPVKYRTVSKNYVIGDLDRFDNKFDGGMCIEVIEHLTPKIFDDLLGQLAKKSNDGALYIFNTGMPEYVINEDSKYLDPLTRGHIVSYSLKAIEIIASKHDFISHYIKGKTWAFVLEFKGRSSENENLENRIWHAQEHNLNVLTDKDMGSVLKILGYETSRAY